MAKSKEIKLTQPAAIIYSLSSMLGIGVFMKTNTLNILSGGNIVPVIILIIYFLIGIFCFCHVLDRIIVKQTGDMGIIEWSKTYCLPTIHKTFCNFIRYFYYPASIFIFSMYAVIKFTNSDELGFQTLAVLALVLSFAVMASNFFLPENSIKLQGFLWKIFIIPILILPLFGMFGKDVVVKNPEPKPTEGGWSVLITGLPALLFIYDGFYNVTSLRSRLKNSESLKRVVISSIVIVTIIYLYVIVGFHMGDPVHGNYKNFWIFWKYPGLLDLFEIFMGMAATLTLNSIVISSMPQLLKMYNVHKFRDEAKFERFMFYKHRETNDDTQHKLSLWLYLLMKTAIFFLVMWILSKITQCNHVNDVYKMVDIIADNISLCIFVIIIGSIISSYRSNSVERTSKYTICTFVACGLIITTLAFIKMSGILGIFVNNENFGWHMIKLFTLLVFILGSSWEYFYRKFMKFRDRNSSLYGTGEGGRHVLTMK